MPEPASGDASTGSGGSGRHAATLRLVLVAVFVGAIVAFFALGGPDYLDLATIKRHRDTLLAFTEAHFAAALAIAFVVYVAAVAFSLPGGSCCR